ncbi:MAG: hypothetical protein Q8933_11430 [Bacteroidota bacterium]|nr:hypothetical protein [Bacteroidota bacterium]MDP4194712.1 hypothetical protein [Bacteroidota bacterium]
MEKYDLAIAYTWEYDEDFVALIRQMAQEHQISTCVFTEGNIKEITQKLKRRNLAIVSYLDRASDASENFLETAHILSRRNTKIFNPYKLVQHAIDKANMHLEFITAGIHTPYSIIIPPFSEEEEIYISLDDLAVLNRPFIIKPANTTGGGIGVVTGAETLKEVLEERMTNHEDKYLLQEKIYPQILDGKRAWFRCFWAFGKVIPCWWDDQTHLYQELTSEDVTRHELGKLFKITGKIAKLTGLDFFSTEIVWSTKEEFIVVDYVNDQCDMRFQSFHYDGVPNNLVRQIVFNMIKVIKRLRAQHRT